MAHSSLHNDFGNPGRGDPRVQPSSPRCALPSDWRASLGADTPDSLPRGDNSPGVQSEPPKREFITAAQWRAIIAPARTLADLVAIAERLDVPLQSVRRRAREIGWRDPDGRPDDIGLRLADVEAAVAHGLTISEIATGAGLRPERLRRWLRRQGSTARSNFTREERARMAIRLWALCAAGNTHRQAAAAVGVSLERARGIMRAYDRDGVFRLKPRRR